MDKTGGLLSYSAEKCCKIIMATMVLHNICINHGLDTVIDTIHETIDDTITPHSSGSGVMMRQEIVSTFLIKLVVKFLIIVMIVNVVSFEYN